MFGKSLPGSDPGRNPGFRSKCGNANARSVSVSSQLETAVRHFHRIEGVMGCEMVHDDDLARRALPPSTPNWHFRNYPDSRTFGGHLGTGAIDPTGSPPTNGRCHVVKYWVS
jgi:hypothetical protein